MNLATRCSHCSTAFRVVQDQLKISNGWVRCGRCNEVFNALEGLMDLDGGEPPHDTSATVPAVADVESAPAAADPPLPSAAYHAVDPPTQPLAQDPAAAAGDDTNPGSREPVLDAADLSEAEVDALLAEPGPDPGLAQPMTRSDSIAKHDPGASPAAPADMAVATDADAIAEGAADPTTTVAPVLVHAGPEADPTPSFLRASGRTRVPRSRRRRSLEATAAVLLAFGLGLQGLHHFRDLIAVRVPAARPVLTTWCAVAACKIPLPRRIGDVTVESTTLTRADTADAYTLSVVLRNRGDLPLALPSIDLSLTDANGRLLARRMLAPDLFRAGSASLAPETSTPLQVVLASAGEGFSGYTVEVFYP